MLSGHNILNEYLIWMIYREELEGDSQAMSFISFSEKYLKDKYAQFN